MTLVDMCPWPATTEAPAWEDHQQDISWMDLNLTSADVDALLASSNAVGEGYQTEDADLFSLPSRSPTPNPLHALNVYEQQQPTSMDRSLAGHGPPGLYPERNPSIVIGQLSQLSVRLSALRAASHRIAQAAESLFSSGPYEPHVPLLNSAAFESVAAWLAHEEMSSNTPPRLSVDLSLVSPNMWPDAAGTPYIAHSSQHTLSEVFAASQRLIEIVGELQADGVIRHLVIACEALLLETYAAILTALQHDAGDPAGATPLGNVRMVIVVQLCAYLIERQHQVIARRFPDATADRETLTNLRVHVQQKLTQLRKTLRCS